MERYETIRMAKRIQKMSIRGIARDLGVHRKTVRKALRCEAPAYRRKYEAPRPRMDKFAAIVEAWLAKDKERPRKQRHTAHRVYTRLVEEYGFAGSESTVRKFVHTCRAKMGGGRVQAVLPLDPEIAHEAEVDWGEANAIIGGKSTKVKLFVMRSRFSSKLFVRAYPNEKQEMFFDGHMRAFAYFGGVFVTAVYDNLKTAVKQILVGKNRLEQDQFVTFRAHYTFKSRFCNPAMAREKGGVEGGVGYARRNFLVPLPEVENFDELNEILLVRCFAHEDHVLQGREDCRTVGERHAEERERLLPMPEYEFENTKKLKARIDRYSTGRVESNRYSVPTEYVGRDLFAHVGAWSISIYDGNKRVAEHARLFGKKGWQLDPTHYLELVRQRIGAFDSARPIRIWRENWPPEYETALGRLVERHGEDQGKRQFVGILLLHNDHSKEKIETAVRDALSFNAIDLEVVRHLISRSETLAESAARFESPICIVNTLIQRVTDIMIVPPDISRYDALLGAEDRMNRGEAA